VLLRAIRSVLAQTYDHLELIVVDDGSTDGTADLLARVNDRRLRTLRNDDRAGAAKARNAGIRAARGELIAFQDSDDEWLVTKLEQQVTLLRTCPPEVGWVGGGHVAMLATGPRLMSSPNLVRGSGYQLDLLDGRVFITPSWLVRRDVIVAAGLFDENLACLEDWDLILRLDKLCRLRAVAEPVLLKYGSADSLFGDVPGRAAALESILTIHAERWRRAPRWEAHYAGELARLHGQMGHRRAARAWLWRSVRLDPMALRTYKALAAILSRSGSSDRSRGQR
jgi:glycosyltransferase involved in cell wall biosynthesis